MKLRLWAFFTVAIAITLALFIYVRHVRQSPPDMIEPCKAPVNATDCFSCGGGPDNHPSGGLLPGDGYYPKICCSAGYELKEWKGAEWCFKKTQH